MWCAAHPAVSTSSAISMYPSPRTWKTTVFSAVHSMKLKSAAAYGRYEVRQAVGLMSFN